MFRLDARILFASAVTSLGAGCTAGVYAGTPSAEAPPVVMDGDADVVYVQGPPAVDIESYPVVVYGGSNVYYVDGRWYQQGPRGWAYYRQEPGELGRQREQHRDDPRWNGRRPVDVAPPAQRPGAAEAQPVERGTRPPPAAQQTRRGVETATPAPAKPKRPLKRRAPAGATAPRPER